MTSSTRSSLFRTRGFYSRALAWVVLVPIVYAVTIGTLHSHADPQSLDRDRISGIVTQAGSPAVGSLRISSEGYECLLCLFHQQLFNSTVQQPLFIGRPATHVELATVHISLNYTAPTTSGPLDRQSGRAPPIA